MNTKLNAPTERALHDTCTMGDLLIRAVSRGGQKAAFKSHGQTVSYAAFAARLSQFSQALMQAGMGHGNTIAVLASNSIEAYVTTSACALLGIRVVQLHPMGSSEDHGFIVDHAEAAMLVFEPSQFAARAAELAARAEGRLQLMALGATDRAPDLVAQAGAFEPISLTSCAEPDDICWLVYTGGTTGKPKGVVHTHRTLVAVMMAELAEWEWPTNPIFLAITPISHGAGPCIPPVLLRGGTVILENGFDPAKFLKLVDEHGVNAAFLVPTMIYKILDHLAGAPPRRSTLQMVIYGAAPMAPARMREALDAFGPVFMQLYGQTEAPNCVCVLRKEDHDVDRFPERLASCGQPIASNSVALLNEEGEPVAEGTTGELCVRGPLVMTGYWKNAEETKKAFRHGWLHTGDLARRDRHGYLYIVGRTKDMIITGGFNVYPAEVEDVVCAHPSVSAVAVIGVPDRMWGEAVKAVVMLKPGQVATADELIARVRAAKGPIYAPKSVEFVESIPLTGLGKPDKKLLREQHGNARQRGAV